MDPKDSHVAIQIAEINLQNVTGISARTHKVIGVCYKPGDSL